MNLISRQRAFLSISLLRFLSVWVRAHVDTKPRAGTLAVVSSCAWHQPLRIPPSCRQLRPSNNFHRGRVLWLSTGVDSSRSGFYKSFVETDLNSLLEVDPITRSQVRERLREKRREPFSKEMGQQILQQLSDSNVVPIRVLVDVDLRHTLRLTRREKKARLFLPLNVKTSLAALQEHVYQAFPVQGMPHNLVVRIRGGAEEDEEDSYLKLQTDEDLARAFALAEKKQQMLQLYIRADKSAAAAMVPDYLVNMADPRKSEYMQLVSFYRFFPQPKDEEGLDHLAKRLRAVWEPFGALGRVYVASEGINAQMAVPANVFQNFAQACNSLVELKGVFLNRDRQMPTTDYLEDPAFDALHIRIRDQVVADGGISEVREYDWSDCGKAMDPEEWHQTVDDPNVIVLDCRNEFESEVGKFASAEALNTSFFRESWDVLKSRLKDVPKDKPILTYCTGGIRCIKVGAYLKQELAFENVARLEGGIVSYARHLREKEVMEKGASPEAAVVPTMAPSILPHSKFKGINYVFDNRLGERITEDVLSTCDQCGVPSDVYVNCANPSCHVRFIQCSNCGSAHHGCCSRGCQETLEVLKNGPPKGGYPAPMKTLYPAAVDEAFLPLREKRLQQSDDDGKKPKRRVWLEPGPFQNVVINRAFDSAIDTYMSAETGQLQESSLLERLTQETSEVFPGGVHMLSGHSQGQLLQTLTRTLGARRVLEIGTFTGYATLCFAQGLKDSDGLVTTCEIDDRAINIAQKYLQEGHLSSKVEVKKEAAMDLLQRYASIPAEERPKFDIIFLDGDKKRYKDYYEMIISQDLLSGGGILIVDNVLWKGLVPELGMRIARGGTPELEPLEDYEALGFTKRQLQLAKVLHDFNMHVKNDPRVEKALLPIRDGLLVIRRKGFERTNISDLSN